MSQPLTVTLHILDKEYRVSCPPEERSNLEQAARHLDSTMRDIRNSGKVVGVERIAVMAALNISHDMLTGNRRQGDQLDQHQRQIRDLVERLDQVLNKPQTESQA
ncbi:cell division protein ZapA [Halopseudomonas phragmitis]|uniref:Cell division protein ZapA n=2 Tax=Pseudomonadaceae TaxID=135621 RepID=A0A1V0B3S4_9GAMM|nr:MULTISPECIES: cell division protein ZapA [Pseudomonadaceae]AQZ94578.1 cell division protein ZapA [Halopseudomonas phragmitis]PAU88306.1 cell division protein ZapA [Pseudomonas sp. WN033]RHW22217.1 cell division protein ZapA [Pseudomonas jilinensis]